MMEWQPIETAPKDGTEVILFCPDNKPQVFTAAFIFDWAASVENRYSPKNTFYGDAPKHPSHWMPLPTAPTA